MEGWIMQTCITIGCGISWYHTLGFDMQRRRDHQTFCCPNGHGQHYPFLNAEEELRKQLNEEIKTRNLYMDQKKHCCEALTKTRHQLNGLRGYVTKLKRIKP